MTDVAKNAVKLALIIAMILCLVSGTVVGVCYALFSKSISDTIDPTVASMSTALYAVNGNTLGTQYTSGQKVIIYANSTATSQSVAIQNTSDISVVMRASVQVVWENADGTQVSVAEPGTYTITPIDTTAGTGILASYSGWTLVETGYYYYNSIVAADETVPFITAEAQNVTSVPTDATQMRVKIMVEVMQSVGNHFVGEWAIDDRWADAGGLGSSTTVDGVALSTYQSMISANLKPNGSGSWTEITAPASGANITSSNAFILPINSTNLNNAFNMNILNAGTGSNNYLRIYNNSSQYLFAGVKYHLQLVSGNDTSGYQDVNTTGIEDYQDLTATINFQTNWISGYDGTSVSSFTLGVTNNYGFIYDKLLAPGESVGALTSTITLGGIESTSALLTGSYALRVSVEVFCVESAIVLTNNNTQYSDPLSSSLTYGSQYTSMLSNCAFDSSWASDATTAGNNMLSLLRDNLTTKYSVWLKAIFGLDAGSEVSGGSVIDDTMDGSSSANEQSL